MSLTRDDSSKTISEFPLINGKRVMPIAIQDEDGNVIFTFPVSIADGITISSLPNVTIGSMPVQDPLLEIARGNQSGVTHVNKFGRAPSGVQDVVTDIWDRADATPTQSVWTAPTQARVHNIKSTSADDDGDSGEGNGARTIRVYGLTSWGAAEVNEDVTLNGVANVATSNSYVIIHRMKVLTKGASGVNVGTITATAVTDNSITAQINIGEGQTQMAIYGFPSTQTAYVTQYYGTINKQGGAVGTVNFSLLFNPEPNVELTKFQVKNTRGLQSTGNSSDTWPFKPYNKFTGPGIFKVQGLASADDIEASAGFDIILVDN